MDNTGTELSNSKLVKFCVDFMHGFLVIKIHILCKTAYRRGLMTYVCLHHLLTGCYKIIPKLSVSDPLNFIIQSSHGLFCCIIFHVTSLLWMYVDT